MGWVLRVFQSRKRSLMLTLLKSLVIPLLEYCCQLWNPWKAKDIQDIEASQRKFTYKVTEVQHLNYWERLHELNFYSLQRCTERCTIIYIWKMHTPYGAKYWWHNGAQNKNQKRQWTQCVIQYPTNRNSTQSLQESAITVFRPRLYNLLPKYVRDIESVKTEKFEFKLDNFFISFLISQKCHTMSPHQEATASSTSLLIDLRAQGIYQSGGVPDSAIQQS